MQNELKKLIEIAIEKDSIANCRQVYDCLTDYLCDNNCNLNFYSRKPCMFESYGTILNFEEIDRAFLDFDKRHLDLIVKVLNYFAYTPLALVLGSYLRGKLQLSTKP